MWIKVGPGVAFSQLVTLKKIHALYFFLTGLCVFSACSKVNQDFLNADAIRQTNSQSNNGGTPSQTGEGQIEISQSNIIDSYGVDTPNSIFIKLTTPLVESSVTDTIGYRSSIGFVDHVEYSSNNPLLIKVFFTKFIFPKQTELSVRNWVIQSNQKTIQELKFYFKANTKIIFASESVGSGNFSSWTKANGQTGLMAAQSVCNAEAKENGWEGNFVPLVSSSTQNATAGIASFKGGWMNTKGEVVANSFAELEKAYVLGAPRFTAKGERLDLAAEGVFWSNSDPYGHKHSSTGSNPNLYCNDWTSSSNSTQVLAGSAHATGSQFFETFYYLTCSFQAHLMCAQSGDGVEFTPQTKSSPRKMFVTSQTGKGNLSSWPQSGGLTGIAAGNKICQTLASNAGLSNPQNFSAFLGDANTSPKDVFNSNALTPYTNTRHAIIAEDTPSIISGGFMQATIAYDELGRPITQVNDVFTGSDVLGMNTFEHSCSNWTSSASNHLATFGRGGFGTRKWIKAGTISCDSTARLVCVEK